MHPSENNQSPTVGIQSVCGPTLFFFFNNDGRLVDESERVRVIREISLLSVAEDDHFWLLLADIIVPECEVMYDKQYCIYNIL